MAMHTEVLKLFTTAGKYIHEQTLFMTLNTPLFQRVKAVYQSLFRLSINNVTYCVPVIFSFLCSDGLIAKCLGIYFTLELFLENIYVSTLDVTKSACNVINLILCCSLMLMRLWDSLFFCAACSVIVAVQRIKISTRTFYFCARQKLLEVLRQRLKKMKSIDRNSKLVTSAAHETQDCSMESYCDESRMKRCSDGTDQRPGHDQVRTNQLDHSLEVENARLKQTHRSPEVEAAQSDQHCTAVQEKALQKDFGLCGQRHHKPSKWDHHPEDVKKIESNKPSQPLERDAEKHCDKDLRSLTLKRKVSQVNIAALIEFYENSRKKSRTEVEKGSFSFAKSAQRNKDEQTGYNFNKISKHSKSVINVLESTANISGRNAIQSHQGKFNSNDEFFLKPDNYESESGTKEKLSETECNVEWKTDNAPNSLGVCSESDGSLQELGNHSSKSPDEAIFVTQKEAEGESKRYLDQSNSKRSQLKTDSRNSCLLESLNSTNDISAATDASLSFLEHCEECFTTAITSVQGNVKFEESSTTMIVSSNNAINELDLRFIYSVY